MGIIVDHGWVAGYSLSALCRLEPARGWGFGEFRVQSATYRSATNRTIDAGQSPFLRDLFQSLLQIEGAEGPKYSRKALHIVAQAVVCRSYEKMALELVHMVRAASLTAGRLGYVGVFWGMERMAASAFRGHFARAGDRPGLRRADSTVVLSYGDGVFAISYGRMPILAGFLEFCVAALGFDAISKLFETIDADQRSLHDQSQAANALSRALYEFLADHLPTVQSQRKFRDLLAFLEENLGSHFDPEQICDDTILAFWQQASTDGTSGDFRAYRTVFLAMLRLIDLLEDGEALARFERTHAIGSDREAGEIDPEALDPTLSEVGGDNDPLASFDLPPLDRVKFLNKRESEALEIPVAQAARLGRLVRSYLRAEVFGAGQFRLIQALRRKAGAADMAALAAEAAPESFAERQALLSKIDAHLEKVALASLYVLRETGADEAPIDFDLAARSRKAFDGIARQGFERDHLGEAEFRAAFEAAAAPLAGLRERLRLVLSAIDGLGDLDRAFTEDRQIFAVQFTLLYGEVS